MATVYLVSTPIGNLGDLSPRARETLAQVPRILAEDTRRTRPLLTHLGLSAALVSLHAHNEAERVEEILGWLADGEDVALVSDAGTPLVSDPGERLVEEVLAAGHQVVPVPGPSAILAALVASGLPAGRFTFLGFLPRKGAQRRELLDRLASAPETTVVFESPERLVSLLEELLAVSGSSRRGSVARELTKLHEEIVRGTLEELLDHFRSRPVRGEVTLVLEAAPDEGGSSHVDRAAAAALADALLEEGLSPSRAAREVARRLRVPRNRAYEVVQSRARGGGSGDRRPS
ncbi:MAG: 16S rRNA (cytidine(1402)-2'-O)-methyltransferase [Gemmatimonadota bacterium]|jgi:16S rRNA (cytidine1402-2'-O)-methyltransferase